jgi:hypothetical protein
MLAISIMKDDHMQQNERKTVSYYLRALHRDVGFFVVGLVIIYALSGIVLVYRDTDFLMRNVQVEKKLSPGIDPSELGKMLRIKGFSVTKTEGDVVHFQNGSYNKTTGLAAYTARELPFVLQKCVGLHKTVSGKTTHWYAILFGTLLCFLAVSSFWMYPNNTSMFCRGICIAVAGAVITTLVLSL